LEDRGHDDRAQNATRNDKSIPRHKKCFSVPATKMANWNVGRPQSDVGTERHNSLDFCLLYTESIFVDNRMLINKLIHT
jgi:hypothetical protein